MYHGRTPHFNVDISVLAPVDPAMVNGFLGQTMRWVGKEGSHVLMGKDADYQVDGLLATDFAYKTFGQAQAVRRSLLADRTAWLSGVAASSRGVFH